VKATANISTFGVVILAAGSSRRMGRPKSLLPWGDTTILGHSVKQWRQLEARRIAVVCAADTPGIDAEMDRLGIRKDDRIVNPDPGRGMFSSIQCAASWPRWDPGLTHWALTLADQPHLRQATLQALVRFGAAHPDRICRPLRQGRPKHPVWLPKCAFVALKDCSAADLKTFLAARANECAGFESEDSGLDLDIDTPSDYDRARQHYFMPDA
jgi:molybdenum cofactor cytidylyltransferase